MLVFWGCLGEEKYCCLITKYIRYYTFVQRRKNTFWHADISNTRENVGYCKYTKSWDTRNNHSCAKNGTVWYYSAVLCPKVQLKWSKSSLIWDCIDCLNLFYLILTSFNSMLTLVSSVNIC